MKLKTYTKNLAAATVVGMAGMVPAMAEEGTIKFGLCYDLSKAYTFITPQVAQGAKDLATLVNMKGGIAGHQIEMIIQDHGNEPQRGIECYEQLKREGVVVFDMLSTPVSIAVLPRVMKDKNVLIQALVGRGDAVDGSVFTQIFPVGPTYLGQAANDIAYIKEELGGDLNGKTIGFMYLDYAFGQEPHDLLKTLAEKEGFTLHLYPVPLPGSDQASTWTKARRDKPDFMMAWLLAGGHVVAAKEMKRNGFPIDRYLSVNWLNEVDISNIGAEAAIGIKRGTSTAGGQDIPVIQELITEVYGNGKGAGPEEKVYDVYYNTGVGIYSTAFEAARLAIEKDGYPITAASMKAGFESITDFDANGLFAPLTVTAEDHGGGGKTRVEMWDGKTWVPQQEWTAAYTDLIWGLVKESSATFKSE
ncbi:ABC transporter substrate-binding protein [Profundibacter sp.]